MNGPADRSTDRPVDDVDSGLRAAVRAYAGGVEPADRLGEIRRAVAAPARRTRPWLLTSGAAVLAVAVVIGFVVLIGPGGGGGGNGGTDVPVADAGSEVTVYEVHAVGGRPWLYPAQRSVEDSGDAVYDAVAALIGDSEATADDAPWSGCPWGYLDEVDVTPELVSVSLTSMGVECDIDPAYEQAQLQQVAWTVHDAVGSDVPVRFWVGDFIEPQTLTADPSALSPVLIDSPADGATVSSPLTVEGRSNTFEGNVQWQVRSGGDVVEEGFETAGTMGQFRPFSFTVDLEPGDYVVRAFAVSMEDGSLVAEDTVDVTIP